MEAVLESVEDEVPGLRLNQTDRLSYPMILAFADDLLIIARRVEDVELVLLKLKEYLHYVGLNLNVDKCKVLIRNPNEAAVADINILGRSYKTLEPLRYLGVYMTARLERPMTTRTRCRTAVAVSKVVMDFLKQYKPSWALGRVIYESVIAPSMLYGTQVAVLTKYSRKSIRGYERQIVETMSQLCRDFSDSTLENSVNLLLNKRRITKKIRMYQMRWWGHVRRRPASHPVRVAARLRAAHLRPCRPSFTWWDSITQSMARYGDLTYDEWTELAKDKERFHKKLLEIYDQSESEDSD